MPRLAIAVALTALGKPYSAHSEELSGSVTVTASVQGVHLVVLGQDGQIEQVWTNTSSADAAVVFRADSVSGRELAPDTNLLASYRQLVPSIDWTGRGGLVWQRQSA